MTDTSPFLIAVTCAVLLDVCASTSSEAHNLPKHANEGHFLGLEIDLLSNILKKIREAYIDAPSNDIRWIPQEEEHWRKVRQALEDCTENVNELATQFGKLEHKSWSSFWSSSGMDSKLEAARQKITVYRQTLEISLKLIPMYDPFLSKANLFRSSEWIQQKDVKFKNMPLQLETLMREIHVLVLRLRQEQEHSKNKHHQTLNVQQCLQSALVVVEFACTRLSSRPGESTSSESGPPPYSSEKTSNAKKSDGNSADQIPFTMTSMSSGTSLFNISNQEQYRDLVALLHMTPQEATAAIGTQRLRGVRPHRALWHPHGSPIVSDTWDHVQHSILKQGLVKSSLILTLACNGLEEPIKLLLDSGSYINTESEYYRKTALMLAGENGYEEVVRLLLDRGAGLEVKDVELRTALMWGATSNSVPIVRLLVERGAKLNPRNMFGETVLLSAMKCRRYAIAEYLRSVDAPE